MKKPVLILMLAFSIISLSSCTDLSKELQERNEIEYFNTENEFKAELIDKDKVETPTTKDKK